MDDLCDTSDTLAIGIGERLYDWRIHSYFACSGNCCGVDQCNFRTQTVETVVYMEMSAAA